MTLREYILEKEEQLAKKSKKYVDEYKKELEEMNSLEFTYGDQTTESYPEYEKRYVKCSKRIRELEKILTDMGVDIKEIQDNTSRHVVHF